MHCKHLTASVSVGIVVQPVELKAEMVDFAPPRAQHPIRLRQSIKTVRRLLRQILCEDRRQDHLTIIHRRFCQNKDARMRAFSMARMRAPISRRDFQRSRGF